MAIKKGLSVLICSHNGAYRIKKTLSYLVKQKVRKSFPWEIVLVDNASTDNTSEVAKSYWESETPLRIIFESKLGVTNARITGMNACQYSYIGFIDDDNWALENWVETAYLSMDSHPDAGAIGSSSEGVYETRPPRWFERYAKNYAIGNQYDKLGRIEKKHGLLWGAGLVLRKKAWDDLYNFGYTPLIESRKGKNLMAGEESELLLLFRLMGWSLYFDPNLKIKHFMPSNRLNWRYYLRLRKSLGATSVYLNLYKHVIDAISSGNKLQTKSWTSELFNSFSNIMKDPLALAAGLINVKKGNFRVAKMYFNIGRFNKLLKLNREFEAMQKALFNKYASMYNIHNSI